MSLKDLNDYFWERALGVSATEFTSVAPYFSSRGKYLERHQDKYVYYLRELRTGKNIFAATPENLELLRTELSDQNAARLNENSVRQHSFFRNHPLVFKDIDYCLADARIKTVPPPLGYTILRIGQEAELSVREFYSDCSEEERDTLDLELGSDPAWAIFHEGEIQGITRFTEIQDCGIADMTVVIRKRARGKGLSTPLVAECLQRCLKSGLTPKYRVEESLTASRRIAESLGFVARFQLLAWEIG